MSASATNEGNATGTAAPGTPSAVANATTKVTTNPKPVQVKLVLLGEAAVGKSSIVIRFVSNGFQENKEPTIGAAFMTQTCRLEDTVIKYEIWDTAGQERFYSLAPMYYRNARAAVVVYDITSATSLDKAKTWVKELQRQANRSIVIAFVGNKLDRAQINNTSTNEDGDGSDASSDGQADEEENTEQEQEAQQSSGERQVPREEAEAFANENGLLFFETSAKTGENIVEVFAEIAKKIPIDEIRGGGRGGAAGGGSSSRGRGANSGSRQDGRISLDQSESQQASSGCNC